MGRVTSRKGPDLIEVGYIRVGNAEIFAAGKLSLPFWEIALTYFRGLVMSMPATE